MQLFTVLSVVLAVLFSVQAFSPKSFGRLSTGLRMSSVATKGVQAIECPDFYWQFRLDRLVGKKGGDLAFNKGAYPDVSTTKDMYDAYYLDLTLNGKLAGFDWMAEKSISDNEWLTIYDSICEWTGKTASDNKPSTDNLPENDFDLLKNYYPELDYRDMETPFGEDEVGANFPYRNMKEMMNAALNKNLNVPGYGPGVKLEATEIRSELAALKESTMASVETIYKDALSQATNPFPDAKAKEHYQALRAKLADFPQSPEGWSAFRAKMEKEVDEMATLASKPAEHGHHGEHSGPTPAEQFEAKYGKSLEDMQDRFQKYKENPEAFLENSIVEKFGQNGLDIWKKSQTFSSDMAAMSEADKAAVEAKFSDFVKSA